MANASPGTNVSSAASVLFHSSGYKKSGVLGSDRDNVLAVTVVNLSDVESALVRCDDMHGASEWMILLPGDVATFRKNPDASVVSALSYIEAKRAGSSDLSLAWGVVEVR